MYRGKAMSLSLEWSSVRGSRLASKYNTRLEVNAFSNVYVGAEKNQFFNQLNGN
jgi:hypothetical protein